RSTAVKSASAIARSSVSRAAAAFHASLSTERIREGPTRNLCSLERTVRHEQWLNVPNALTILRLGLIPVTAYFLFIEAYAAALATFLTAALTDFADGYIARHWKITSKVGAALDPIADKLNMLVATLLLAWQSLLPVWLAVAIVLRDVLIVA